MRKLIVIDGLDGSGKATQAQRLAETLRAKALPVREVSFPDYVSPSSALIKMYLAGEFGSRPDDVNAYAASSFFAVDRYASFQKDWRRDWENGLVIADRYTTSNAIHQCSKLPEAEWAGYLDWLFDYEYRLLDIPEPNLVVYLHVDPAVSQKLLEKRYGGDAGKKDLHEKDLAYLVRCQTAAKYCAAYLGWRTVECTRGGAMRPVEEIGEELLTLTEDVIR